MWVLLAVVRLWYCDRANSFAVTDMGNYCHPASSSEADGQTTATHHTRPAHVCRVTRGWFGSEPIRGHKPVVDPVCLRLHQSRANQIAVARRVCPGDTSFTATAHRTRHVLIFWRICKPRQLRYRRVSAYCFGDMTVFLDSFYTSSTQVPLDRSILVCIIAEEGHTQLLTIPISPFTRQYMIPRNRVNELWKRACL